MINRAYLLLLCLVISISGRAQDVSLLDSLRSELLSASDATVTSDLYEKFAWEFRKAFPDSTIHYAQKSIALIEKEGLAKNTAQALTFIGVAYQYKGENIKSFDFYTEARNVALNAGDTLQFAHSLNSLGRLHFNQGSFLKAYDNFYKALGYFTALNDSLGSSYVYKSLSELYRSQNNLQKAREMAQKTLEIRQELGDYIGQISVLVELAAIYVELQDYEEAFKKYLTSLELAESISDEVGIARVNLGISQLYSQQQNSAEALIYAQKATKIVSGSNNEELLNQVKLQYAKSLMALRKYSEAKKELEQMVMKVGVTKQLTIEMDVHLRLAEIYELQGDTNLAFQYFKRYAKLNEAWSNAEAARSIERLESRLALESKEKENELLRLNEARSVAVIERQRFANIALIAVVTLIGILLISIWYVSRKRKQTYMKLQLKNRQIEEQANEISKQSEKISQQNQKLQKRNHQLADLNNEKDTLMNIVAHDLKSPINRVKGITELLSFSELNEEQRNYVNLLKQISNNSTDLIRDLLDVNAFGDERRKLNLSTVNLTEIIASKRTAFKTEAASKNILISLDFSREVVFVKTDESLLVRILDNLISNAIKFSNADTTVTISVHDDLEGLRLFVKDQGPGFTEADKQQLYQKFKKLSARPTAGESSNGLGLAIVKILCERLEITIELQSDSDVGSNFILKFPESAKVPHAVEIKP